MELLWEYYISSCFQKGDYEMSTRFENEAGLKLIDTRIAASLNVFHRQTQKNSKFWMDMLNMKPNQNSLL